MRFYADLHVHSKYSRATSRDLDLEHLAQWAKLKGITVVGTGDFTHPAWWQEIQDKLVPAEPGLYRLRPDIEREVDAMVPAICRRPVRFLLEVEISTIYKKGDRTRKVHHLIYAAEMDSASRFRNRLDSIGNIKSDGRPILGLDSRHLLEITLESGPDAYLIPAHIWTPWFSAMGSKSGFDAIDDCYGDLSQHIFAVETGLSSDPPMNWRVSHLDRFTLVSNSDAHSPGKLGREACVFDTDLDYYAMRRALETRDGWGGTVEFFPQEGKYHLDGHRKCNVRLEPEETRHHGGSCPACGKPVTIGVLHRVEELADRTADYLPPAPAPFRSLVPLPEVMSEIRGFGPKSKAVTKIVSELIARLGPELEILETQPLEDVQQLTDPLVAEALSRLRDGRVRCESGFDGEYGTIKVFQPDEVIPQLTLATLLGVESMAPEKPTPQFAPPSPQALAEAGDSKAANEAIAETESTDTNPADTNPADAGPLGRLDADQRQAAERLEGPMLIVAGPGSGKTRTLTHRIAHLIDQGTEPRHCLAVTFTRRAADEMRERLEALLGDVAADLTVTTFHGLGIKILRQHGDKLDLPPNFRIADDAARTEVLRQHFAASPKEAKRWLSELSQLRRDPSALTSEPEISVERYRAALRQRGLVDFLDLLVLPLELFATQPELEQHYRDTWRWLSVDEYQDIDALQYRLLRHLVASDGNLCAIGDPDQSIYRFRGAEVAFFLRFRQDFPAAHQVQLGRNYRSQASIVHAAHQVIAPATLVPGRRVEPVLEVTPRPVVLHAAASPRAEAEFVVHSIEQLLGGTSYFSFDSGRMDSGRVDDALSELSFDDFAVLYRTKAQAAAIAEALERSGMPYQQKSHERLADLPAVRWLSHELHLIAEQQAATKTKARTTAKTKAAATVADQLATVAEAARQNLPDGVDEAALDAALELVADMAERHGKHLGAFLDELASGAEVDTWDPRAERISLLTLHAAKGLEFPVVFIVGCEEGLMPLTWTRGDAVGNSNTNSDIEIDEERRLFFVGMTRARSQLYLSHARHRSWRGEKQEPEPSRFLADIEPALIRRRTAPPAKPPQPKVAEQLKLL